MADPVTGQPTVAQQAAAGAGVAANPWAEYGLNPDGTPIAAKPAEPADLVAAENASLKEQVAALEAKLAKVPDNFEGVSKKLEMLDRFTKAIGGDPADDGAVKAKEIYADLKSVVSKSGATGVAKLFAMLEADPDAIDKLQSGVGAVTSAQVVGLNEKAHDRVVDLAKKAGFKGSTEDVNEIVFPFEQTMTMMINSNPDLRKAFLSGRLDVVDQIFNRMIRPHVAQRLRNKQAAAGTTQFPKAPPRGGAAPGDAGDGQAPSRDLSTPKGKAEFHKNAVNRWLDKVSNRSEE